jgi:Uma2 family endonuclease
MAIDPQWQEPHPGGPMSVEEYLRLDKSAFNAKYEYIDGETQMRSGGSIAHDTISQNVYIELRSNFRSGPCSAFSMNMQVQVGLKPDGQEYYLYPDTTVSCNVNDRRLDNTMIRSPHIVVEVLSPSTEHKDRGKKLKAYKACPTIHEIVLISQFARYVEVYSRDEEDQEQWRHAFYDSDAQQIVLSSLDIHIAMDDIYKGINFDEPLMTE